MHGALLAVVQPDNTPHGANLTFAIPVVIFVVVAVGLFLRFRAPHTVPGHVSFRSSRWASSGRSGKAAFGEDAVHAAVGTHAEPTTGTGDATERQAPAPGTVQSETAAPATETGGQAAATEQAKPAEEGREDGE